MKALNVRLHLGGPKFGALIVVENDFLYARSGEFSVCQLAANIAEDLPTTGRHRHFLCLETGLGRAWWGGWFRSSVWGDLSLRHCGCQWGGDFSSLRRFVRHHDEPPGNGSKTRV